jgi:NitT/TauT family transport system ATP-binding protein
MGRDNTPVLTALNLYKHYQPRQGGVLAAIADISFTVSAGEFVCLVGPSGCGKTTLLRVLAGLLMPDSGQVYLHDQPLQGPRREIGVVFQKANLMPWRTVLDNVRLPLQIRHMAAVEATQRAYASLEMVGLHDFARSYPHELSGGMQQRVAIARALVYEPEILLLDEPFGPLDALTRERLNQELLQVWEASRKTVIMVTHDIREAAFLADRVIVLSRRPGQVADIISIPFGRPREESLFYDSGFNAVAYQVRRAIQ